MQSDICQRARPAYRAVTVVTWIGLIAGTGPALSAPVIQQISGALNHKGTITISGSGFGTKTTGAPLVWDDASGSSIGAKWDGAWPDNDPAYNTAYRAPQRGIDLPHNHIMRYIAGAHAGRAGANGGYNVMVFKNFTLPSSFPQFLYASWYQRADDAWVFGGDNNFKVLDYSAGTGPYDHSNWYCGFGPPNPSSRTSSAQWGPNDDGDSLMNPDMKGRNYWWKLGVNPMSGVWTKVEIEVKITNQNDGFIRVTENASHVVIDYAGPTDKYAGNSRTFSIGGYSRMYGQPNNWRYYADTYVDTTLSRVVLANAAKLSSATIVETQVPTAWSANLISATLNLGKFTAGQTAYLFVFDSTGTPNATGFAVTAGGSALPQPEPPSNISIH
jgi:hypothetical protein